MGCNRPKNTWRGEPKTKKNGSGRNMRVLRITKTMTMTQFLEKIVPLRTHDALLFVTRRYTSTSATTRWKRSSHGF